MEGAPRVLPQRVTLAEQLAASSNLRDLLKLRHDEDAAAGRRRTLLDVIRAPEDDDDDRAPPAQPGVASATTAPAVAPAPGASPAGPAQGEERRVSLMALLEQAERQWATATASGRGAWTRVEQAAAAAEEEDAGTKRGVGGRCCVCMSRRKGAAFVPCGHTFCRACAREVRAGRGRCPLCNAAIRDVLNLF
uniref:Uncharacterized protein n=1 Tax=Avena sativa TaxID=4498 RepID=A0ACD5Y079_AVESA